MTCYRNGACGPNEMCPFCDICPEHEQKKPKTQPDVVEVRHGKWKHLSGDEWICNQCGFVLSTEGSWEHPLTECEKYFCEHCGADMREETE